MFPCGDFGELVKQVKVVVVVVAEVNLIEPREEEQKSTTSTIIIGREFGAESSPNEQGGFVGLQCQK